MAIEVVWTALAEVDGRREFERWRIEAMRNRYYLTLRGSPLLRVDRRRPDESAISDPEP